MTNTLTRALLPVIFCMLFACSGRKTDESTTRNTETGKSSPAAVVGLEIGNEAPDMAFLSPEGKTIALSSLRGKVVLIDFWASWCMPCRIENPNLVHIYKKFRNTEFAVGKGFTIYSVSLDKELKSWKNGIAIDSLEWESHVSDLKGWNSAPAALYKVASIPANFLIDGRGIIIAKNLRAEALETTIGNLL